MLVHVSSNGDVISLIINIIANLLLCTCFQSSELCGWLKEADTLAPGLLKTFAIHNVNRAQVFHCHHCNLFADCTDPLTGAELFFFHKYVQLSLFIFIFSRKGTIYRIPLFKMLLC